MNFIYGKNPVFELLRSDAKRIIRILIAEEVKKDNIEELLFVARKKHRRIEYTNNHRLDSITSRGVHQGVLAFITSENKYELDDLLKIKQEKQEKAFFIILDSIFDPQNFGSIIRTAEGSGAHGIIIPRHRTCKVTPTVAKASAGAVNYIPIIEVSNIVNCINFLKEKGVFIIGADNYAKEEYLKVDMNKDIAIVIGNEDTGIRRLTKEKCDMLVKIPMRGKMESLNTSVSASILIYEALRQRSKP
jgi:23S rRNA (guanosine2251-2'-O)-methyltransferase